MKSSSAEPTDPFVAVVIPCRNEGTSIRSVIDSLLRSSHPRERLEVVFVDGMSTDGTRAILEAAVREHPFIRVIDNPLMTAPAAMNLGIRATRGEIIVRIDAHSEYPRDYIPSCVRLLQSGPKVGNAGGRFVPLTEGGSPWARAVAHVTAHRFGVGDSAFRTSWRPGPVDTVPYGTFRRAVLSEVGLYDERLTRNQDNELNARIKKAGYEIVFDPNIHIRYRNQASLAGLLRQAFFTGEWNVYTLYLHPYTLKWRRFVPLCFVTYLIVLAAVASTSARAAAYLAPPLGLYAALVAVFSVGSGPRAGGRARVAATFASYHLWYGAGSLIGIMNILTGRWRAHLGKPLSH